MRNATLLVLALAAVGCESVESTDILTSGLYPNVDFIALGDGASEVRVTLRVGGSVSNTYVDLEGDDRLTATVGEQSAELEKRDNGFDYIWYQAGFTGDDEGTKAVLSLERTIDAGAPASTAELPGRFDVTAPEADAELSREEDTLVVSWEPSGSADVMTLSVRGECFEDYSRDIVDDPGEYVVSPEELVPYDPDAGETCDGVVEITRSRAGSINPAFEEGGGIAGRQVRQLEFRSTP